MTTVVEHPLPAMRIPEVPSIVTADQLVATGRSIVDLQLPSGMIQWFPDGHADPWNHVEAAMALATVGFIQEAEAGYQWLVDSQLPNGAWHNYYLADGIEDSKFDSNCVAYLATGVWHHYLVTGNEGFLTRLWPTVERAIEFVLDLQTRRGEIIWAARADGSRWSYALLTGSSSISHSLRCASAIADTLGHDRPHWTESRDRLVDVIANMPEAFEPKNRWAMDWYYPVLTGAVTGDDAAKRMADGWETFVMMDKGVRCVSDRPWVTAAETCECVMALLAAGDRARAEQLFTWAQRLRDDDGAYFTGLVFPELVHFPDQERSSYTAGAVILAADALDGRNPTSNLFITHP
ncbi:MAG: prenyltransferase [Actinomycetota bacterium]